jgi:hypothetical protein
VHGSQQATDAARAAAKDAAAETRKVVTSKREPHGLLGKAKAAAGKVVDAIVA